MSYSYKLVALTKELSNRIKSLQNESDFESLFREQIKPRRYDKFPKDGYLGETVMAILMLNGEPSKSIRTVWNLYDKSSFAKYNLIEDLRAMGKPLIDRNSPIFKEYSQRDGFKDEFYVNPEDALKRIRQSIVNEELEKHHDSVKGLLTAVGYDMDNYNMDCMEVQYRPDLDIRLTTTSEAQIVNLYWTLRYENFKDHDYVICAM